jgi:glycosyltransferase involved in cell wall biosynthesis
VEKKGFADLVEAVARLHARGAAPDRVVIAGDGPLRGELEAAVARHGLGAVVKLPGALGHDDVRALLEQAALLCAPCVIAADGDRDSMPVVVKEALAMEVPVVTSDVAGLPEIVAPPWGRLVPPHDPEALADALQSVLAAPPDERAAMGRAGREHVLAHASLQREAAKLAALAGLATSPAPGGRDARRGGSSNRPSSAS